MATDKIRYVDSEQGPIEIPDHEYIDHGWKTDEGIYKKVADWLGLRTALLEHLPEDRVDKILATGNGGVYKFISHILCANERRGARISELMEALDDARDAFYKINAMADNAMCDAGEAINKVGDISMSEMAESTDK